MLPEIQTHERVAECRNASEEIAQPAVGHQSIAHGVERSMAQAQGLGEIRHRRDNRRSVWLPPGQTRFDGPHRRDQPMSNATKELSIRFVDAGRLLAQLVARVNHRQLGA
jgi:hypothetical protein